MGRIGDFGAENCQKRVLNDILTNFGHNLVTMVAHGVIVGVMSRKSTMDDTLKELGTICLPIKQFQGWNRKLWM
jgi:hypothetical protein